jgi:hypothetical protein
MRRLADRRGVALVIVLCGMLLLSVMALAVVLLSIMQTLSAGNEQRAGAALYAAEAALERALPDLLRAPDWDAVLDGRVSSGFVDGSPGGPRRLPDGSLVRLEELVASANCGAGATACTDAQMNAVTAERPWGPDNPRWRLFAYGPLRSLLTGGDLLPPEEYVVVLVADDPAEADGDPLHDGRPGTSPGAGVLQLRALAFGPQAAHRALEIVVARGVPAAGSPGYAGQRGQGSASGAVPGSEVQIPGAALGRSEMTLDGGLFER